MHSNAVNIQLATSFRKIPPPLGSLGKLGNLIANHLTHSDFDFIAAYKFSASMALV